MLIIGIAGGRGSGKTTVVRKIVEALPKDSVAVVPPDAYYYDNGHLSLEDKDKINFDHPNSIEWNLLNHHIKMLKNGHEIKMPTYSYVDCARGNETFLIRPPEVVIIEGILILTNPELRSPIDIKLFVSTDSNDRLIRFLRRDISERGRTYEEALTHYDKFVKLMHQQFIEPAKQYANGITPQGGKNKVAIDIVVSRIKLTLGKNKSLS